jgi:hypothetical protein
MGTNMKIIIAGNYEDINTAKEVENIIEVSLLANRIRKLSQSIKNNIKI